MPDSAAGTRGGPGRFFAGLSSWGRSIKPDRRDFGKDALAGLPGAISSVPDGMASAVLVGVNPVHGLYASFAGPIAGGLTSSTRLMVITTTTAAALAAGSAVSGLDADQRPEALFLLTGLAGLVTPSPVATVAAEATPMAISRLVICTIRLLPEPDKSVAMLRGGTTPVTRIDATRGVGCLPCRGSPRPRHARQRSPAVTGRGHRIVNPQRA
jgi:hypothetical protein